MAKHLIRLLMLLSGVLLIVTIALWTKLAPVYLLSLAICLVITLGLTAWLRAKE